MTSESKSTSTPPGSEGGGMLPALLAGAGILLVAGLFIFGGDDEKKTEAGKDPKTATSAQSPSGRGGSGGINSRPVDEANKIARPGQPKLNPRIANAVVTEGMAPSPNKKEKPSSFSSKADEIAYWEEELRSAESNLQVRQMAAERAPREEARIREHGSAEDLAQYQKRMEVVADNLEQAEARVAEVEAKLAELR